MTAYSTTTWTTTAHHHLHHHPNCVDCGQPATQVDHTPPRQLLAAAGIHNPDAERWLHSRCTSCHSRKTATIDRQLLQRWKQGEDAQTLCEDALDGHRLLGYTT